MIINMVTKKCLHGVLLTDVVRPNNCKRQISNTRTRKTVPKLSSFSLLKKKVERFKIY